MSRKEYELGMDFVKEHFFYVYPPELPTPDYILERFAELVIKHGVKRLKIDPFNQLNHLMQKRDDIYLAECLTKFERFAQQHGVYMTIIAHPNRTQKDDDGNYKSPDVYDINGGPVWNAL
jgi:twinkle protein